MMKKFNDLEFKPHPSGAGGERAFIEFDNGYGVSVLFGKYWYSNGVDTYELGVFKDNQLFYSDLTAGDVVGYISKDEVNRYMEAVQNIGTDKEVRTLDDEKVETNLEDEIRKDLETRCTEDGEDMLNDEEMSTYLNKVYATMTDAYCEIINKRNVGGQNYDC